MLSAKMQAGRDAETLALRQRLAQVEAQLEQRAAEASHFSAQNVELKRQVERSKANEATGFLKDIVFKYLVAGPEQQATIFSLLCSVLQFSKEEVAHIQRSQEHVEATSTASGLLSSFFFSEAPPEQESFADPAASTEASSSTPAAAAVPPRRSEDEMRFELFAGRGLGSTPSRRAMPAEQLAGTPFNLTATPLSTPFDEAKAETKVESTSSSEESAKELADYKRKVARLKKLLTAANEHIDKFKSDLAAKDAALAALTSGESIGSPDLKWR